MFPRLRIPRPRFSLLTLVLVVIFAGACSGLWLRWEPWECERVLPGATPAMTFAAFSPDGQRILTNGQDHTARILDTTTGRELVVFKGHTEDVGAAAFSPDGQRIATASKDSTLRLWDAATGRELVVFKTIRIDIMGEVGPVSFSPDGRWIAVSNLEESVFVWSATVGQNDTKRERSFGAEYFHCFSPDSLRILTLRDRVAIWDLETGLVCTEFSAVRPDVFVRASFAPDGRRIVTSGWDNVVRVWDVETGRESLAIKTRSGFATFSPCGKRILTLGSVACVWDARTGQELAALPRDCFALSPDGQRIMSTDRGDNKTPGCMRIWNRRRPEWWWGIAWLPEFWIALVTVVALLAIVARNLRSRFTKPAVTSSQSLVADSQ